MTISVVCCPWEDGAITGIFAGWVPEQKTIKTRCGRRLPFRATSAEHVTCPRCLAHIEREKAGRVMIERYAADALKYGVDEANRRAELYAKEHGL